MGVCNNAADLWTNGQNFVSSLGKTNPYELRQFFNSCFECLLNSIILAKWNNLFCHINSMNETDIYRFTIGWHNIRYTVTYIVDTF